MTLEQIKNYILENTETKEENFTEFGNFLITSFDKDTSLYLFENKVNNKISLIKKDKAEKIRLVRTIEKIDLFLALIYLKVLRH